MHAALAACSPFALVAVASGGASGPQSHTHMKRTLKQRGQQPRTDALGVAPGLRLGHSSSSRLWTPGVIFDKRQMWKHCLSVSPAGPEKELRVSLPMSGTQVRNARKPRSAEAKRYLPRGLLCRPRGAEPAISAPDWGAAWERPAWGTPWPIPLTCSPQQKKG